MRQTATKAARMVGLERVLLTTASFVVVVAGMKAASGIVVAFLLAVFIAIVTAPVYARMRLHGISSFTSLLVLMVGLAGVGFLLASLAETSVREFTASLPKYQSLLVEQRDNLMSWLSQRGVDVKSLGIEEQLDPRHLVRYAGTMATAFSSLLGQGFLILVIVVFILLELAILPEKIRRLPGLEEESWVALNEMVDGVRRVMSIKTAMSLLTGLLVGAWAAYIGLKHYVLLGLLAFVLNYLPAIGSIVAAVPAVLLALIEIGAGRAIVCGIGYLVINLGVSNFLEPRFMGRGLGLSPLVVLISIIFWAWVFGPIGMLLSFPLTMVARIALDTNPDTRWIAVLLGPGKVNRRGGDATAPPASPRPVQPESSGDPSP